LASVASGVSPLSSSKTVSSSGGGAFIFPYILILIIMVFPVLTVETAVGQFFRQPVPEILDKYSPKWRGVVYLELFTLLLVSSFYIYLMAYPVIYIFNIFAGRLDYLNSPQDELLINIQTFFSNNILQRNFNPEIDVLLSGVFRRGELEAVIRGVVLLADNLRLHSQRG